MVSMDIIALLEAPDDCYHASLRAIAADEIRRLRERVEILEAEIRVMRSFPTEFQRQEALYSRP